jgi:hypothetical protein
MEEPTVVPQAKLSQLALARASGVAKKRQRDLDLSHIREKIDLIDARANQVAPAPATTTDPAPAPAHDPVTAQVDDVQAQTPAKRQRVTREPDPPDDEPSWVTCAVRTGSLLALSGLSWYVSNIYGRATPVKKISISGEQPVRTTTTTQAPQPMSVPVRDTPMLKKIGASGFVS